MSLGYLARTTFRALGALCPLVLAACAGVGGLPTTLTGGDAEASLGRTMAAMCAGPGDGEIEAMRDLATREARTRAGLSWSEQQSAAGVPPDAAERLTDALAVLGRDGDPGEAEDMILDAMAIEDAQLAPLAPARLTSAGYLASLYTREGRFVEAIPVERYIVALNGQAYGPFYEGTVDHMMRLAILELEAGDVAPANERYGCAKEAAAALWGPGSGMLARLDAAYRRLAEERAG